MLVLADKYDVVDLREVCIRYARANAIPKLQLKDVFHVWFQYATRYVILTVALDRCLSETTTVCLHSKLRTEYQCSVSSSSYSFNKQQTEHCCADRNER